MSILKSRNAAYIGVLSALAVILGYLEQMISLPVNFPGVKLGLSNICVILALYKISGKQAFAIALIKSLICGILFWGIGGTVYGVVGALLSVMSMTIIKNSRIFGTVGVSVVGALFHNIGQLMTLFVLSGSFSFMYYMCVLGVSGVVMGVITGAITSVVLNNLNYFKKGIDKTAKK